MSDILYSPWRMEYINSCEPDGCIFCIKETEENDLKHLILHRSKYSFVIMNMFPYNNGHLMVVPKKHTGDLNALSIKETNDLFDLVRKTVKVLKDTYNPEGLNIGMNLGKAAGSGVDEHLHVHIVPRWSGDVNFMTSVGSTRVIPENFSQAYNRIKEQFDKLHG